MHIVGELCKSFERKRPVPEGMDQALRPLPFGAELAKNLEVGLASVALGFNGALKTAVENDNEVRDIAFAQEAFALLKPGDVLLAQFIAEKRRLDPAERMTSPWYRGTCRAWRAAPCRARFAKP